MANIPEYVLRTRREAALWECLKRNRQMSEETSASLENKSDQNASEGLATASQQYANHYKQTADSIQRITRINAMMMVLTVGLVVGTWAQAYWTRETLRDSERAWIGVTTVRPIFVVGTVLIPRFTPGVQVIYRVDVESVNGGRGPAINVKTMLRLRVGKPIPTRCDAGRIRGFFFCLWRSGHAAVA